MKRWEKGSTKRHSKSGKSLKKKRQWKKKREKENHARQNMHYC